MPEFQELLAAVEGGRSPVALSGAAAIHRVHIAAGVGLMTGRPVGGEEAAQIGLATRCVPEEELAEATSRFAAELAKGAGKAISCQKELINKYFYNGDFPSYMADEAQANHLCSKSADFEEAVDAFIEKRRPAFSGK